MCVLLIVNVYVCVCVCVLVGTDEATPENSTVQNVVRALFTPYLTKAISKNTPNEVLDLLCNAHTYIQFMRLRIEMEIVVFFHLLFLSRYCCVCLCY